MSGLIAYVEREVRYSILCCNCDNKIYCSTESKQDASIRFKAAGWKESEFGPLCPICVKKGVCND